MYSNNLTVPWLLGPSSQKCHYKIEYHFIGVQPLYLKTLYNQRRIATPGRFPPQAKLPDRLAWTHTNSYMQSAF